MLGRQWKDETRETQIARKTPRLWSFADERLKDDTSLSPTLSFSLFSHGYLPVLSPHVSGPARIAVVAADESVDEVRQRRQGDFGETGETYDTVVTRGN